MLSETLVCDKSMLSCVDLSLAAKKMHRELTCSQAAYKMILQNHGRPCKHFQCQNRRFRVFEAGYWKEFQN
jgi:hypothetical protein